MKASQWNKFVVVVASVKICWKTILSNSQFLFEPIFPVIAAADTNSFEKAWLDLELPVLSLSLSFLSLSLSLSHTQTHTHTHTCQRRAWQYKCPLHFSTGELLTDFFFIWKVNNHFVGIFQPLPFLTSVDARFHSGYSCWQLRFVTRFLLYYYRGQQCSVVKLNLTNLRPAVQIPVPTHF